jgi:hypothetical protein
VKQCSKEHHVLAQQQQKGPTFTWVLVPLPIVLNNFIVDSGVV